MPFQRLFSLSFSLLPHRREQQQQENASSSSSSSSPPPSRQSSLSTDSTTSFPSSSPFSDAEKRDYHHSRHDGHGESDEEWEMGTITARKARVLLPSSSIGDRRAHFRRGSTAEKKRAGKDDEEEEEEGKEQEAAKLWREWWI